MKVRSDYNEVCKLGIVTARLSHGAFHSTKNNVYVLCKLLCRCSTDVTISSQFVVGVRVRCISWLLIARTELQLWCHNPVGSTQAFSLHFSWWHCPL